MRRKFISIVLFIVLLFTVVPVQQIGSWLANSGMSEEIAGQAGPNIIEEHAKHFSFILSLRTSAAYHLKLANFRGLQLHHNFRYAENILNGPITDVVVPPPKDKISIC